MRTASRMKYTCEDLTAQGDNVEHTFLLVMIIYNSVLLNLNELVPLALTLLIQQGLWDPGQQVGGIGSLLQPKR